MEKEALQKEIDFQRDVKTHLWNALIVSTGGTLALLFNLKGSLKIGLFILGILFIGVLFFGYFRKDDQIDYLIKKLRELNQ